MNDPLALMQAARAAFAAEVAAIAPVGEIERSGLESTIGALVVGPDGLVRAVPRRGLTFDQRALLGYMAALPESRRPSEPDWRYMADRATWITGVREFGR